MKKRDQKMQQRMNDKAKVHQQQLELSESYNVFRKNTRLYTMSVFKGL